SQATLRRRHHRKSIGAELNLHPLIDLSLTKQPRSARLRHFTIRIAATSVQLRGLVQHVLSPSSLLPGLSLSLLTPTL
ncbi:MAG TPA: hypothetical protein VI750_12955, partial [Pyrinomonadaceae bacterium]|nr:hypothetical protein [Pyrinomonadaceae bacterium]